MASCGSIQSCISNARGQITGRINKQSRLTQLSPIGTKAENKLTPTPPKATKKYKLNTLKVKSPRRIHQNLALTPNDTFLYAEKHVNPVIERLAQQLVLHNPKQQQLQHFMIDALEGKSLSTKYPVNRDLTALKATVKVKSDPKAILPVETRKVLNNLILSIFKSRPTNVKQFILDSSK